MSNINFGIFLLRIRSLASRGRALYWRILTGARLRSVGRNVCVLLNNASYVKEGCRLGDNSLLRVWPLENFNAQHLWIGSNFALGRNSEIMTHGGYVEVGNNVSVGNNCQVQGKGGVVINDCTIISSNVFISSSNHDTSNMPDGSHIKEELPRPVFIGANVWVGANVTITAGTSIGDNSVIAAGAVVNGVYPNGCLLAGVPAIIKRNL